MDLDAAPPDYEENRRFPLPDADAEADDEEELEPGDGEDDDEDAAASSGARRAPAAPPREDCWSDGATWALIDAWGERHRQLSRGSLRQQDWREVAAAVSGRDNSSKPPKTDSQCKNRIDTLKKKLKLESSKPSSSWPFLPRLRRLLSAAPDPPTAAAAPPPPASFRLQMHHLHLKRKRTAKKRSHRKILQTLVPPPAPAPAPSSSPPPPPLSRAISSLAEAYERIETRKLQQAADLERQRIALARELELQRMEFFTKTLLELTQLKHRP